MDLIKMARELGKNIQESEEYKKLYAAKEVNDNDQQLQKDIEGFNMIRMNLSNAMQEENRDEAKVQELNTKLNSAYTEIMKNPNMLAFNEAKQDIDRVMNGITTVLMCAVNGEDPETCEAFPESCGGSCSTCGGCH